jgi:hypothetical protein
MAAPFGSLCSPRAAAVNQVTDGSVRASDGTATTPNISRTRVHGSPAWSGLGLAGSRSRTEHGQSRVSLGMSASGGQPRWVVRTVKPSPMSSRVMSPTNPALRSRRSCSSRVRSTLPQTSSSNAVCRGKRNSGRRASSSRPEGGGLRHPVGELLASTLKPRDQTRTERLMAALEVFRRELGAQTGVWP